MTTEALLEDSEQVAAVREFNRFYTARVGLLQNRYLGGEFSLTESRILYEIAASPRTTASAIRKLLALDAGYISRVLTSLKNRGLLHQKPSKEDPREKPLTLSPAGRAKVAELNRLSDQQMHQMLQNVAPADRQTLVDSLSKVKSILCSQRKGQVRIERISTLTTEAIDLLREYYHAAGVIQRDGPKIIKQVVEEPASGLWLAYREEVLVGCVMLKPLDKKSSIGECKRLYVRPSCRRSGIAEALVEALETFARNTGLKWIYLDTNDTMAAAIALYRRRGYSPCERYNDNPRANLFFRKKL